MTKQEIIDYVVNTPSNSNQAVLSSMLDSFVEGESGGDGKRLIWEDTIVTTKVGSGSYYEFGTRSKLIEPVWIEDKDTAISIEVDGTIVYTSTGYINSASDTIYSVGVFNPGDTRYVAGCELLCKYVNTTGGPAVADKTLAVSMSGYLTLHTIEPGTHSVKIYKEV